MKSFSGMTEKKSLDVQATEILKHNWHATLVPVVHCKREVVVDKVEVGVFFANPVIDCVHFVVHTPL